MSVLEHFLLQDPFRGASWGKLAVSWEERTAGAGKRHNDAPFRPRSVGSLPQPGLLSLVQTALASDSEQASSLLILIVEEWHANCEFTQLKYMVQRGWGKKYISNYPELA